MCPEIVQRVYLESGQWGTVGSVICWNYAHDGEQKFAKEIVEAIDEERKSITFNVIEGDVLAFYNTFKLIVGVDTHADQDNNCVVTWSLEYEKKTANVPDPHTIMNLGLTLTKEIERQHMLEPNKIVV